MWTVCSVSISRLRSIIRKRGQYSVTGVRSGVTLSACGLTQSDAASAAILTGVRNAPSDKMKQRPVFIVEKIMSAATVVVDIRRKFEKKTEKKPSANPNGFVKIGDDFPILPSKALVVPRRKIALPHSEKAKELFQPLPDDRGETVSCLRDRKVNSFLRSMIDHIAKIRAAKSTVKKLTEGFRAGMMLVKIGEQIQELQKWCFSTEHIWKAVCNVLSAISVLQTGSFSSRTRMEAYRNYAKNRKFTCSFCSYSTENKYNLKTHLLVHSGQKPYICAVCHQCFSQKQNLKTHLRIHTGILDFETTVNIEDSFLPKLHRCSVCAYFTPYKHNLNKHMLVHTKERPYICKVCNKCFSQNASLKRHFKTHTGEFMFKCSLCDKKFVQKSDLRRHVLTHRILLLKYVFQDLLCFLGAKILPRMRDFHNEVKTKFFIYSVCSYHTVRKYDFMKHVMVHTGEQPYVCEICSQCFVQKQNLRTHLRCHGGECPFQCSFCGKKFTRKYSMLLYARNCNNNILFTFYIRVLNIFHFVGEEIINWKFSCPICSYAAERVCDLQEHMLVHKKYYPYICDVCNKRFTQKGHLKVHLRIHTGERPYACEVCKKTFSQKQHLNTHSRLHTGEYPYQCSVCGKKYKQKLSLQMHQCAYQHG
ncbi:zinc finger protein 585B-like [Stegodyphus dumicola]|uniref:zinc finger protein 585B-like n=1 Tax=Stegodyphus dumicola TaxID=202533 RepID=UPI0015A8C682|nr:zinc finger protein 585B-like [Stegodyphus dumicola]